MSSEQPERVPGWERDVLVFDDRVEVRCNGKDSLRYEEIRSVTLSRGPIVWLTIKSLSGDAVKVLMWRADGLRARRLIQAHRRKLKKLREVGFASLEDFEARAAELGKRLGIG